MSSYINIDSKNKILDSLHSILIAFVLLDVCFFPYIRQVSCLVSMLVVIVWFCFFIIKNKLDNELYIFIFTAFLVLISMLMCYGYIPSTVYTNWTSSVISTSKYTLTYSIIFIITYFYYFFFKYESVKKISVIRNLLPCILFIFFLLSLIYYASPSLFYQIRTFWTMSGRITEATNETASVYRFTSAFSDPNDAACVSNAIFILIFEDKENKDFIRFISFFLNIVVIFATMSTSGIISLFLYFIIKIIVSVRVSKIKIKKSSLLISLLLIVAFLILIFSISNSEIFIRSIKRIFSNEDSGNDRLNLWLNLLKEKGIFKYLIFGFGNVVILDKIGIMPHNGHLQLIYSYGVIVYLCFIYLFFRKRRETPINFYLFIIPFFFCFSMNGILIDARFTFAFALLISYASHRFKSKPAITA